jgi:hypothetical protein
MIVFFIECLHCNGRLAGLVSSLERATDVPPFFERIAVAPVTGGSSR